MARHGGGISRLSRRLILVAAIVPGGCTVGPDFHSPAPPAVDHYVSGGSPSPTAAAPGADGASQHFVAGAAIDAKWWTLFGSPTLDALEEDAIRHNADIGAARAALRQAHEMHLAQRASLFPTIQAGASAYREKNSYTIASPLSSNAQTYTLYAAQFEASYVLDLFGGVRRQIEASTAQEDAQRFQVEATYLALTSNVASTVLQIAALRSQLEAANAAVATDRRIADVTRRMYAAGESNSGDVASAENAQEQAEQAIAPLQKQIDQSNDQLAVFLGRTPAEIQALRIDLADVRLPADLPLSLPSELVRQRPDIRAAEANLHIASAQVGVAIAARLPSISLVGTLGGNSTTLGSMFSAGNDLWTIGGSVSQTVFDAGALRHQQKATEAALAQAKEQYRGTVLTAFQNTADVLMAIESDAGNLRHAVLASAALARSADIARNQVKLGEAGSLAALNAEVAEEQGRQALIQARAARYADTVALFQALGGGWWNNPHATEETHE